MKFVSPNLKLKLCRRNQIVYSFIYTCQPYWNQRYVSSSEFAHLINTYPYQWLLDRRKAAHQRGTHVRYSDLSLFHKCIVDLQATCVWQHPLWIQQHLMLSSDRGRQSVFGVRYPCSKRKVLIRYTTKTFYIWIETTTPQAIVKLTNKVSYH